VNNYLNVMLIPSRWENGIESVIIDGRIILKQILKINWIFYVLSFSYIKVIGF